MPEQPHAKGYALTIRFSPEIERGLEVVRKRAGVGPTDYIRLAVYRALQADIGMDHLPTESESKKASRV